VLISLIVIIGIYTSVGGTSLSARQDNAGAHPVSGSMVNLDHYRSAQANLVEMQVQQPTKGHGCDHEMHTSSDD
jgi:hypothetical protein